MMSDAGYGYPNGYGSNGVHYTDMNGDVHGHGHLYHENGRHHHQPFGHLQYAANHPYPRYPSNFDRIHDVKPHEGTNAPLDTSQYTQYPCSTVPATHQAPPPPPPPTAHTAQPLPYDANCAPRPSLSPQESQPQPNPSSQQYPSCKMMQHAPSTALHPLSNDMSPVGAPLSPTPSHMYHNGPGQHSPNRSDNQSFLYPWMKSQFGKLAVFASINLSIQFDHFSSCNSLPSSHSRVVRDSHWEKCVKLVPQTARAQIAECGSRDLK